LLFIERFSSVLTAKVEGCPHVAATGANLHAARMDRITTRRQDMRRRLIIATALAATGVLAIAPGTGASAKAKHVTKLSCGLELSAQGPPQGTPPQTTSFGLVTCPRPLGRGLHYSTSSVTPTAPGQGTVAVSFKKYFDRGTIRGTVAGTFAATSPMNVTNRGTVTVTGGTGAFKRVKGRGSITCTSADGGAHRSCTFKLRLTGV
jgi:hypothetical protein